KHYHMSTFPGREKASIIRVFAKEENTQIYRDGLSMGLIKKAGGIGGEGWLDFRAAQTNRPVSFSGDKPISVTQYNTSRGDDGQYSEPAQVTLIPVAQYSKSVDITTPGTGSGGFASNIINIVYESENSLISDDFEFGELVSGEIEWSRLNAMSTGPGQEFLSPTNNKKYYCSSISLPGNGAYKIRANSKFAVYMLGIEGQNVCAYPAACGMIDLTKNDTLAPRVTMTVGDGTVDGKVTDMPAVADERSNLAIIYMNSKESYNCELTHKKLIPGYTRQLDWDLNVIDINENARAVISFIDRCGNDTTIVYNYNPIKLAITPEVHDFGHLRIGVLDTAVFWVHNVAEEGVFMLDTIGFQNEDSKFAVKNIDLPLELQPGDSVEFSVHFISDVSSVFKDSLGAGADGKYWFKACVKGSAGVPVIKTPDIEFPDSLLVGKSAYKTGEVTNIGDYDLEVYSWSMTESAGFSA
ncbi:MAG: IgGFc-binding protein, partial [Chlorobi bacterium]|nr:IgGFc-binding protein [Chlorobiota bacterium]